MLARHRSFLNRVAIGWVLSADGAAVRLSIRDDRVGGADPGSASGLLSLRDRVEALGGKIEIQSKV